MALLINLDDDRTPDAAAPPPPLTPQQQAALHQALAEARRDPWLFAAALLGGLLGWAGTVLWPWGFAA